MLAALEAPMKPCGHLAALVIAIAAMLIGGCRDAKQPPKVIDAKFEWEPLDQVLDELSKASGIPIRVDWPALEAAGIERDVPVAINIPNAPVLLILRRMLAQEPEADLEAYDLGHEIWITRRRAQFEPDW